MNKKERNALELARHELMTLHGLIAADGTTPEETWDIDTSAAVAGIDDALKNETIEKDPIKRELLSNLVDMIEESASMLTIDDIHYLTVQLTLAWQHPVVLLTQIKKIYEVRDPLPNSQQVVE
jgi:hypothetical protein